MRAIKTQANIIAMIMLMFLLCASLVCLTACGGNGSDDHNEQLAQDAVQYLQVSLVDKTDPLEDEPLDTLVFEIKIKNNSALPLHNLSGVVTFYHANGELLYTTESVSIVGDQISPQGEKTRIITVGDTTSLSAIMLYYTALSDLSVKLTLSGASFVYDGQTYAVQDPLPTLSLTTEGGVVDATQRSYREALLQFHQKQYSEALTLFQSAHPYMDTATYIDSCQGYLQHPQEQTAYDNAITLWQEEKFADAIHTLQGITSYKDAKDRIAEIKLSAVNKAYQLANMGQYADACALIASVDMTEEAELYQAYTHASQGDFTSAVSCGLTVVVLPEGMETVPDNFMAGQSTVNKVVLPSTVKVIGQNAFKGCVSLAEINFPNPIQTIGDSAFEGCVSLKNIRFKDELSVIGSSAFRDCTSLVSVEFPFSSTSAIQMQAYAFAGCEGLTSLQLPSHLQAIPEGAFENCQKLQSVVLPQTLSSIGSKAFKGCADLADIPLGNVSSSLGEEAFYGCTSLSSVMLSETLNSICANCFVGCTNLTSLSMYNGEYGWTTDRIEDGSRITVMDATENARLLTSVSGYCNATWTKATS